MATEKKAAGKHGKKANLTPLQQEYKTLVRLMKAYERGEELMVSYKKEYLEDAILQFGTALKAFPPLVKSLITHDKLHEMDDKMDKPTFEELVKSDYFQTSGTTPDGQPILWIRQGYHCRNMYALKADTPKFWAYVRASLFGIQACHNAMFHGTKFTSLAVYVDDAEGTNLGFNLKFTKVIGKFMADLFPVLEGTTVFFGGSLRTEVVFKALRRVYKRQKMNAVQGFGIESVHPFVADISTIPSYMIEEEDVENDGNEGADVDGKSTWCYKRLIKGCHITAAEVFNPPPYEKIDQCSEEEADEKKEDDQPELKTYDEDEEVEEGW